MADNTGDRDEDLNRETGEPSSTDSQPKVIAKKVTPRATELEPTVFLGDDADDDQLDPTVVLGDNQNDGQLDPTVVHALESVGCDQICSNIPSRLDTSDVPRQSSRPHCV